MVDNQQKGRTLLEVLMVLSLIGILSIGLIAVVNSMINKYKLSRIGQQLVDLQKGITDRYSAEGTYSTISIADLISQKIVPNDMVSGGDLKHALGGPVFVSSSDPDDFSIEFDDIPPQACLEMATIIWTKNDSTNLKSIKFANGDTYIWKRGDQQVAGDKLLPINMEKASEHCTPNKEDNAIEWTFY